jgi:glutaredoxin
MSHRVSAAVCAGTAFALLLLSLISAEWSAYTWAMAPTTRQKTVWLVFFFSHSCPKCEPVRELLDALKSAYPIRIKSFDVEKPEAYELYRRLEAIHAKGSFAIPLVMLNNSILMGERDISAKLERMVSRLSRKGGASLPYLGPDQTDRQEATASPAAKEPKRARCDHCSRNGRPPSIQEDWSKIRALIDRFF